MKHVLKKILLLSIAILVGSIAYAQITKAEYFFDTDPGVGNGVAITLNAINTDSSNYAGNIAIPNTMPSGVHTLYVRAYTDADIVLASNNYTRKQWGIVSSRSFVVTQNNSAINKMEYFFDTDPGVGNATNLLFTTTNNSVAEYAGNISTTGLSAGVHSLYVRAKRSNIGWGIYERKVVFVAEGNNAINAMEYFFDTDPGVGNTNNLSFTTTASSVEYAGSIAITGLSAGVHNLYVRAKRNKIGWGMYDRRVFFVTEGSNRVTAMEYFFDTDPGVGNGTAITFNNQTGFVDFTGLIASTNLKGGFHNLYVRAKYGNGNWGNYSSKPIYIKPKITSVEYYVDKDPGVNNGTAVSLTPAENEVVFANNIRPICLKAGNHNLFVRAKDELGVYSSVYANAAFTQTGSWMSTALQSAGPGPYGTPVRLNLTTLATGSNSYKKMSDLNWQAEKVVLVANIDTTKLLAKDGFGCVDTSTIITNLNPTVISTTGSTANPTKLMDGWNKWVYVLDTSHNIVAALNDKGNNWGVIDVDHNIHSGAIRTGNMGIPYHNRNFMISSTINPDSLISIMLYSTQSEYNALKAADPVITQPADLVAVKYRGNNQNLSLSDNDATGYTGGTCLWNTWTNGTQNGFTTEFTLKTFCELYFARSFGITLPLSVVELNAKDNGHKITVNWQVENEQNIAYYEIMRSTNGVSFNTIGMLNANNTLAKQSYQFNDVQFDNEANNFYYKIKIVQQNGLVNYSKIVNVVKHAIKEEYKLNANPVTNGSVQLVAILGSNKNAQYQIVEQNGRVVATGKLTLSKGTTYQNINIANLSNGLYTLLLITEGHKIPIRFLKQ